MTVGGAYLELCEGRGEVYGAKERGGESRSRPENTLSRFDPVARVWLMMNSACERHWACHGGVVDVSVTQLLTEVLRAVTLSATPTARGPDRHTARYAF